MLRPPPDNPPPRPAPLLGSPAILPSPLFQSPDPLPSAPLEDQPESNAILQGDDGPTQDERQEEGNESIQGSEVVRSEPNVSIKPDEPKTHGDQRDLSPEGTKQALARDSPLPSASEPTSADDQSMPSCRTSDEGPEERAHTAGDDERTRGLDVGGHPRASLDADGAPTQHEEQDLLLHTSHPSPLRRCGVCDQSVNIDRWWWCLDCSGEYLTHAYR